MKIPKLFALERNLNVMKKDNNSGTETHATLGTLVKDLTKTGIGVIGITTATAFTVAGGLIIYGGARYGQGMAPFVMLLGVGFMVGGAQVIGGAADWAVKCYSTFKSHYSLYRKDTGDSRNKSGDCSLDDLIPY